MSARFGILMVCTANLCRSPMMELLLRKRLDRDALSGSWSIGSAGVDAVDGQRMHPSTVTALAGFDVDEPNWRSRRLNPALLAGADLILAADLGHRRAVAQLYPAAVRRTFLLLPFAALVAMAGPVQPEAGRHDGGSLINAAVRARSRLPLEQLSSEIADPIGHPVGTFRVRAAEIDRALADITHALPAG